MKFAKHIPALLLFFIGAIFLCYFLPDRDIVRIVGTDIKRFDINSDTPGWDKTDIGTRDIGTRDVRLINAVRPNGNTIVFRNEDTGWGFPPYFKFDSGDVTTRAQELANVDDQWVAVRHYGWRIKMFSISPNVTSIKRVDGPNVRLIPWFNIVFIGLLLFLWGFLWWKIRSWKAKRIDPTLEKVGDSLGDAAKDVSQIAGEGSEKARGFWKKLFGSSKPSGS